MSGSFFAPVTNPLREQPQTNIHAMVDLETFGTNKEAPIITIGAVLFDPWRQDSGEALYRRAFLRRVTVESSLAACPKVDAATLQWWFTQPDEAIKQLVGDDAIALRQALIDFRMYCFDRFPKGNELFFEGHSAYPQACMVWAKDPDFDCVILDHAYRAVGELNNWQFWQNRSVRTIQDLAWPEGQEQRPDFHAGVGVKHDARADAVSQALMVQAAYLKLGLSKKPDVELMRI